MAHAKVEIGAMLPMQLVNSWFLNAQVGFSFAKGMDSDGR